MPSARTITTFTYILIGLLLGSVSLRAQEKSLNADKWAIELDKKNSPEPKLNVRALDSLFRYSDSLHVFKFIEDLEEKAKSKGDHFKARVKMLRALAFFLKYGYYDYYHKRNTADVNSVKEELMSLYTSAIELAYRSEDDYLIAEISSAYAAVAIVFGEIGLAVMYSKNAVDLWEKLHVPVQPEHYQYLAEILYKVREYNESIRYARKAVDAWQKSPNEVKRFTISSMNTVALGYHRQNQYDSAFTYYNRALQLGHKTKDTIWTGIVSGNMGQVFYMQGKYDTAYALFKLDYQSSKESQFYDNAANSLQWAARTSLVRGDKTKALAEVREAFQLLKIWPDPNYLRNAYYTSMQIFREMGNYDSAFYYNSLHAAINDSLEKVVATSSLAISKAKLNDETSRYNIQSLNKERRAQVLYRNVLIAAIVILSLVALLIVNRQRLKEKIKSEQAQQAKWRMEQEVASAKQQLGMFTANIVEKTNLIEKLEMQAKGREATIEQQTIISELSQKTILTEEEWTVFKSLFEKIYPGFFINLVSKFPDITLAEQRMAALTRLHLSTKQIASMLGISVDSVHKSRQRLRQRFQVTTETNLEDLVSKL